MTIPRAILEEPVMHDHDAGAHAEPYQRQILARALLEESVRPVQLDVLHFPPMPLRVRGHADGSILADV